MNAKIPLRPGFPPPATPLWERLRPHKEYLLGLKKSVTVDVFLGYRSNCDHCGVEVPHTSLEMFWELKIPFGLSIIVV